MIRRISDAAHAARRKAMEAAREAARKAAEAARQKAAEAARKAAEAARQRDQFEAKPKPQVKPGEVKNEVISQKANDRLNGASLGARQLETKVEVQSTAKMEGGKASVGLKADVERKSTIKPQAQAAREAEEARANEAAGTPAKSRTNKVLDGVQQAGTLLAGAGLKKTWEGESWDTTGKDQLSGDQVAFAGGLSGTRGSQSFSVGADGVKAEYERGASAGLYAQKNDRVDGAHGSAAYQAGAKVEVDAGVKAEGTLDANGLDASVNAQVGVRAEASASGQLETRPITISGVEVTAGVEGNVKVSAEAEAHATGSVKVTRDPPTAIIEGEVGASAVVKAEADLTINAGPFAVNAGVYGSAGAEATAGGAIGFEDGKLKINGRLGAALGLGGGVHANVEIDVAMIGEMALNAADLDGDGKLGVGDLKAGAEKLGEAAVNLADRDGDGKLGLGDVKAGVEQFAGGLKDAVSNARDVVSSAVNDVREKVTERVSDVVEGAKDTVKSAGRKVARFFGF